MNADEREAYRLQKEIYTHVFSLAQNYNQFFVAVAYAGFFAVWGEMADDLGTKTRFASALLIACSVAAFASWELYAMLQRRAMLNGMAARLKRYPESRIQILQRALRAGEERGLKVTGVWRVVFPFAVGTAAAALATLLSAFVHGIWLDLAK